MGEIRRYTPSAAADWDTFVDEAKNGTFLFKRGYMDYHAERFADHSLLYYTAQGQLRGLLPANLTTDSTGTRALHSHQGLTYGGFILGKKTTMSEVMEMFTLTLAYLKEQGIHTFYYKQVPTCYHRYPAQEDDYALWRLGATLTVCNISSAIEYNEGYTIPCEYRRRRGVARAKKAGYTICAATDLAPFWTIVEHNLQEKYHVRPVHTLGEITLLQQRFPDNIKCVVATRDGVVEAGILMYLAPTAVHVQYPHASAQGKAAGALDLLYAALIPSFAGQYRYFDIGISNEDEGRTLNYNLLAQKEGLGARGIAYKQWTFRI